jgi:hypothetical protein
MRSLPFALLALLSLCAGLAPAPAPAQVDVHVQLALPVVPPLVVVQPGIQVVRDYDDEVFVHGGWYWLRRGPVWYRAPGPRAAFVVVEPRVVPAPLVRLPPGHYRRYHPRPAAWAEERHERRREERERRRAWKDQRRAERREWHERHRERRHEEHDRGRGHGRD